MVSSATEPTACTLQVGEALLGEALEHALAAWSRELRISIENGDVLLIEGKWYIMHSGLLRLARRKRCYGIHVDMTPKFREPRSSRCAA